MYFTLVSKIYIFAGATLSSWSVSLEYGEKPQQTGMKLSKNEASLQKIRVGSFGFLKLPQSFVSILLKGPVKYQKKNA